MTNNKGEFQKVRCKNQYGTWLYVIIKPSCWNDLDAPIYRLFDENEKFVNDFGSYGDMKTYIETGEVL